MVNKIRKSNKKYEPPSKLRNKKCPKCKRNERRYTSSSLGRHLKTVHGAKWVCSYCNKKYTDKNSHKICFEKEKHILLNFMESYKDEKIQEANSELHPSKLNLSFLFDRKGEIYYSPKLKLGQGHFSNVFYGIHMASKSEIAIKISKEVTKIPDYDKEELILRKLDSNNFFPKVCSHKKNLLNDYLPISLMGPNLLQFLWFYGKGFDRKTIINISIYLLKDIEFLASGKILHRDIKPENVVFGVMNLSEFEKKNYF